MNREHLCTEQEAAHIAGVSPRTLLRFSEAGYLTLYTDPDGSHMFECAQVQEIFGLHAHAAPAIQCGPAAGHAAESFAVQPGASELPSARTAESTEPNQASPLTGSEHNKQGGGMPRPEGTPPETTDEIARLRNLLALQERILDSKDDEIADLRNQRAWLRERIEKLEDKSDRDQILLLSETQMIRSLIAYQESRKSTLRQLLEWVGVVRQEKHSNLPQPQPSDYHSQPNKGGASSRTIEVATAANSD